MMKFTLLVVCLCVCRGYCAPWTNWFTDSSNTDTSVAAVEAVTEQCLRLNSWGSCEFYDCLERRFPCGAQGYTRKISKHFCNKIDNSYTSFDAFGRRWLNSTSICLVGQLRSLYQGASSSCAAIKDAGIEAIIHCNSAVVDGQTFCDFLNTNGDAYSGLMGAEELQLLFSLRDRRVVTSMVSDAVTCGVSNLSRTASSIGVSIQEFAGNIASTFRSWFN